MAGKRNRKIIKSKIATPGRDALYAFIGLAGILLVFYWKNLVGFPFGHAFFWEDFLYQNFPYRVFEAVELRSGSFPFWNPFQFGGMPFVADIQAAAVYPLNFILPLFVRDGFLHPAWVEGITVLHALLGGFFFFLLVRKGTSCVYASFLSGAGWALSGFVTARMMHMNILCVVAWTPIIILLLMIAIEKRSLSAAIVGGLFLGNSLLGGSPQYSLYLLIFIGLYTLYEVIRNSAAGIGLARFLPFIFLAIVVLVGVALSAVQLLPTSELTDLSVRADMSYEKSTEGSCPPASLPMMLMPHLYGSVGGWQTNNYWGPGSYYYAWEMLAYTGMVLLLLSTVPLVYCPRAKVTLFFALFGLFALLLSLGESGPLHKLFYQFLPTYGRFRFPGRALFMLGMAITFLGGQGASLLRLPPPHRGWRPRILSVVIVVILAAGIISYIVFRPDPGKGGLPLPPGAEETARHALYLFLSVTLLTGSVILWWVWRRGGVPPLVRGAILLLMLAELFVCGFGFNSSTWDPDAFYRGNEDVLNLLRSVTEEHVDEKGAYRVKTREQIGTAGRMILPRNMGSVNRIQSVDGYNQLKLQRYEDLNVAEELPFERFLDLLSVRAFTYYDREKGGLSLAGNYDCLPPALYVPEAEKIEPGVTVIERLSSPGFDPFALVILETDPPFAGTAGGRGEATVIKQETNGMTVHVECDASGYLLLNVMYYPAWHAYVDGKRTDIYPADHALCAVPLESGTHRVDFRYESGLFRFGLLLSLLTIGLATIYFAWIGPSRGDSLRLTLDRVIGRTST